jgi:adenylate cyclase
MPHTRDGVRKVLAVNERHHDFTLRNFRSALRRLNRQPRLVAPVRRTREWMMGEERTAERLLGALGRPADLAVHELAALESGSRGMLGEIGLMGRHAWQRIAESQGRGGGVLDVAVLFTDLVGFSDWALASGDELAVKLLQDFSETIEPTVLERGGEVVKRLGDGLMAVFRDAQSAVEAAFDAHERAATIEMAGSQAQLKTGVHLGRPRKIGGDYLGIDVNIAARLLEAAKPGEILVSDRTLLALDAATVTARERRFSAVGVPRDLHAHVVERAQPRPSGARAGRAALRSSL